MSEKWKLNGPTSYLLLNHQWEGTACVCEKACESLLRRDKLSSLIINSVSFNMQPQTHGYSKDIVRADSRLNMNLCQTQRDGGIE